MSEGIRLLERAGAVYTGVYTRRLDAAVEHSYVLVIKDHTEVNRASDQQTPIREIRQRVSLITNDEVVQITEVNVIATDLEGKFREYWSRYTARGLFLENGPPDEFFVSNEGALTPVLGPSLLITYDRPAAVIEIRGTNKENGICPSGDVPIIDLRLSLYDPASPISVYSDGRVPPTDREVWLPIQEVLRVGGIDFYNGVISDPTVCY